MASNGSYAKSAETKFGRLPKRGTYDYEVVHTIIDTCPVLHVSFNDPDQPFPVVLPMLGCTGRFDEQDADPKTVQQDVYIHGYVSGRIFRQTKDEADEGVPITVAASHMDGLVLALSPFHNSCNYRSAIVYGHATVVTSPDERLYAMTRITDNMLPTRWDRSRNPPTTAELNSTAVLKVRVQSASAKVRTGGPHDDRADLQNAELVKGTWVGTVPVWLQWGEPIPSADNGTAEVEGYIERWRMEENRKGRVAAYEAIQKDGK